MILLLFIVLCVNDAILRTTKSEYFGFSIFSAQNKDNLMFICQEIQTNTFILMFLLYLNISTLSMYLLLHIIMVAVYNVTFNYLTTFFFIWSKQYKNF